jgi:FMN phosphatase YigB (HAD superfamily)
LSFSNRSDRAAAGYQDAAGFATRRPGVEVIHVAASQPLDMAVCKSMGIRAFWVNRRDEKVEVQWLPFTEVKDVAEAAQLILG